MSEGLKSPLRYYGGKAKLAGKLIKLIPDHETYVEVFAGGLSVFFAKETSELEIVNDLDSDVFNFYRVLRDPEKFKRFEFLVNLTPYSKEEFDFCRDPKRTTGDDVESARRWFVCNRLGFISDENNSRSFGRSIKGGKDGMAISVKSYLSAVSRLPEIAERLKKVQIEHDDYGTSIKRFDQPGTFFYLDPPYVHSTRKTSKGYRHEMADSDHKDLVEILLKIQGKAMLSGYRNPIYGPLECAGWKRHDFKTTASSAARTKQSGLQGTGNATKNQERTESVWVKDWSSE